jgi:hypothetical protein
VGFWHQVVSQRRSASDFCCQRWSVFAPLSCGLLTALATASAFAADDWGPMAVFGALATTFSFIGIRNVSALKN